nr:glycosyltransferase family 2 protein [Burkholderia vietnamiensis]
MDGFIVSEPLKDGPLVSVIIATFNCVQTVRRAIESVSRQTYKNTELIIVDGNSTDGTLKELEDSSADIDKFVSEKDNGIYDAWNKGIRLASGEWLCFIGADDVLLDSAISDYIQFIDANPSFHYVSSKALLVDKRGRRREIGQAWKWRTFKRYMNVAHVGSLHHRDLFSRYGFFDEQFKICGDYELLLRPRERLAAGYFEKITAIMAAGGISQANSRIFNETYLAKVSAGGRDRLIAGWEKCWAQAKWCIKTSLFKFF